MATCFSRGSVYAGSIDHLCEVLSNTSLHRDPFPHITICPFFPPEIYEHLLSNLPPADCYRPFAYLTHAAKDGTSTRNRFQLTDDSLAALDPARREFFLGIRDALGCSALKDKVFQVLAPGLALRFGLPAERAAQIPAFPLPELFRESAGYSIKPHPDTRKKIVTMQIALPRNDRHAHLGTEFYTRSLNPLSLGREPRGFNRSKTMPFLPNSAYAFVVLNTWSIKSWHGRTQFSAECDRESILNIWYASAAHANPDIVRDHYPGDGANEAA